MEMPHFFSYYFLLLIAGSLWICGLFMITRGEKKKEVDGKEKKVGQIFRFWYFLWHIECKKKKRTNFKGGALFEMQLAFTNKTGLKAVDVTDTFFLMPQDIKFYKAYLEYVIRDIEIVIEPYFENPEIVIVSVYKTEPDYVFPEWIRKPIAGCITCWGSVYGSLVFVLFHKLVSTNTINDMYSMFEFKQAAMICTWLAYMVTLAFTNTAIWKKWS